MKLIEELDQKKNTTLKEAHHRVNRVRHSSCHYIVYGNWQLTNQIASNLVFKNVYSNNPLGLLPLIIALTIYNNKQHSVSELPSIMCTVQCFATFNLHIHVDSYIEWYL